MVPRLRRLLMGLVPLVVLLLLAEGGLRLWGLGSRLLREGRRSGSSGELVLAFGDSWTWGHGVERGEAWPDRLPEVARARGRALRVENHGVPGSSAFDAGRLLQARLAQGEVPAIVLVQVGMNPDPSAPEAGPGSGDPSADLRASERARRLALVRLLDQLAARRRLLADALLRGEVEAKPFNVVPGLVEPPEQAALREQKDLLRTRQGLARLADLAHGAGAEFRVVSYAFPSTLARDPRFGPASLQRKVRQACAELGLVLIDVQAAYDASGLGEAELLQGQAQRGQLWSLHPNARGHALFAEAVAASLP